VASLAASFGRGAMTNHWIDMINTDVAMICGSNAVENHPVAARWLQKAKANGAIVLSCDPRYTRTTAFSDHYCKMRSGTDIAFVGGMINYALQNDRVDREYVRHYTNATFIIDPEFEFNEAAGLFVGYNPDTDPPSYDKSKWKYELDENGAPKRDMTMEHPRCVFQLLKKHFARYDIDMVCSVTGAPKEEYQRICDIYTSTWAPNRVATWLYAMGTTQHTHGTQNIRTYVILQLLLGNVGKAGGGINALRGESNVQGSTDMALLFHILPGYLRTPPATQQSLDAYLEENTPKSADPLSANWWQNYPKYMVSLLKAFWGDHATRENGFCYSYLGKISGNLSYISLFEAMYRNEIKGLFCFGQNPAVGGPNCNKERDALANLEWLVAVDIFESDTSVFWKRPGVDPKTIQTEVFLLPAVASMEKEGSVVNSGRWAQWRYKAADGPGDAISDAAIVTKLVKELKALYQQDGKFPQPILQLTWDYDVDEHDEPNIHRVAAEINGYYTDGPSKGKQVASFAKLADDGTTCSGNWLYCGSYVDRADGQGREAAEEGKHLTTIQRDGQILETINRLAKRLAERPQDVPEGRCVGLNKDWSWCWPVNRRIIYNRASVDLYGKPWSENRWVIRWDPDAKSGAGAWDPGGDVPDGGWPPMANPDGTENEKTKRPFIMRPEGVACLFATGLNDGPFPEHYEPLESPIHNLLSARQTDPAIKIWEPDKIGTPEEFPIVATTYRVCEHWQAGAMTRNVPWLVELVPNVFVEMSPSLAQRKGVQTGEWVRVTTKRGELKARALVTNRFEPFFVGGKLVDQIGIPWHWGYNGLATGDSANMLTPHVGDANTMIPEYKAFLCQIEKVGEVV
jgi:anaerobic selenocysteine-containing dehydrogenase